jgi:hypothetical protein
MVCHPMDGILNRFTETVHRQESGPAEFHTACGAAYNLSPDQLEEVSIEWATTDHDASKCGRCFEEAGGY